MPGPSRLVLLFLILFAGLVAAAAVERESLGDISHVNRSIHIDDGARAGKLSTVNGAIVVGAEANIDSAETVNGAVRLGRAGRAAALETVNGSIVVGPDAVVTGSLQTVNGAIDLGESAEVQGDAENINGRVRLARKARVGGRITTYNGDISVAESARAAAGITVKKSSGWSNWFGTQRRPLIRIGADAVVGDLHFEREVELRVHPSARIGRVEGATALPLEQNDSSAAEDASGE